MDKKVSVIIPVYNCEKYIHACLKSLLFQTYKNLEIILIDDGSYDKSSFICDQYSEQYAIIKVVHQANKGPGVARNAGLDLMTGDYLTFVDSDDYVAKNYIEILVNLLEEYHAEIAEVGLMCMYQSRNIFENSDGEIVCFEGSDNLVKDYFSQDGQLRNCIAGRMYDMGKFKSVRFSEKFIGEDSEYSLKMLSRCERLVKYHKCLYACRGYQESLTRGLMSHKHFDVVDIFIRDVSLAKKMGVEFDDWESLFQRYIHMCYGLLEMVAEQKREADFSSELNNIVSVYWKINKMAEEHNVSLSISLVEDVEHIDIWAQKYRKKNRLKIIIKCIKNYILHIMGTFKVIISYEYKFDD